MIQGDSEVAKYFYKSLKPFHTVSQTTFTKNFYNCCFCLTNTIKDSSITVEASKDSKRIKFDSLDMLHEQVAGFKNTG